MISRNDLVYFVVTFRSEPTCDIRNMRSRETQRADGFHPRSHGDTPRSPDCHGNKVQGEMDGCKVEASSMTVRIHEQCSAPMTLQNYNYYNCTFIVLITIIQQYYMYIYKIDVYKIYKIYKRRQTTSYTKNVIDK